MITQSDLLSVPDMPDVRAEIDRLRWQKNAVVLAHYYQNGLLQDIADFVGDSLDLSRRAAETRADVIVFCGVRFMGEVAKILNPDRLVLLPDNTAGCSLEESCNPSSFKKFREKHPNHLAVSYINCSAAVKALSDVIVTSSNAEGILKQIPVEQPILFAPDYHLGHFLKRRTGRENMVLWPGACVIHEQFSALELRKLKVLYPDARVVAHPECQDSLLLCADYVGSTHGMLQYVTESTERTFIIATEPHLLHQMVKVAPHKRFLPAPGSDGSCNCAICPHMARNTLTKVYLCLANESPRIEIAEDMRLRALQPLQRMLDMSLGIRAGYAAE